MCSQRLIVISSILFIGQVTSNLTTTESGANVTINVTSKDDNVNISVTTKDDNASISATTNENLITSVTTKDGLKRSGNVTINVTSKDDNVSISVTTKADSAIISGAAKYNNLTTTVTTKDGLRREPVISNHTAEIAGNYTTNDTEKTALRDKPAVELFDKHSTHPMQVARWCVIESGVHPNIVYHIKEDKVTDDEKTKKFLHCTFDKLGYIKPNGQVDKDKLLTRFRQDTRTPWIKAALEWCFDAAQLKGVTPEDELYSIFTCFQKKSPVIINYGDWKL